MASSTNQATKYVIIFIALAIIFSIVFWSVKLDRLQKERMTEICQQEYNASFLHTTGDTFVCLLAKNGSIRMIEIRIKKK